MKEYSEKLLENIDRINMNENLKELQRNWIGKSEGMEISFDIVDKMIKNLQPHLFLRHALKLFME